MKVENKVWKCVEAGCPVTVNKVFNPIMPKRKVGLHVCKFEEVK